MTDITKAIIPVAGLGTRVLPATKAIPKEMMTLVDRPLVQYAVDEAKASGITDFVFVTNGHKSAMLEDHFATSPELDRALWRAERHDLRSELRACELQAGTVSYVRQDSRYMPLGIAHAVWCARSQIGENETFAVILPDDMIEADAPCLAQMIDAYEGGCMVAAVSVSREDAPLYGMIRGPIRASGEVFPVSELVEKPAPEDAFLGMGIVGRYILSPDIVPLLLHDPGDTYEFHLTGSLAALLDDGGQVSGYSIRGRRFDCGSKAGYLQATVAYALSRPDLEPDFRDFVRREIGG